MVRKTLGRVKYRLRSIGTSIGSDKFESIKRRIEKSGYFEPDFYLNSNKDVKEHKVDPLEHFVKFGRFEGRSPGVKFNIDLFYSANPHLENKIDDPFIYFLSKLRLHRYAADAFSWDKTAAQKEYIKKKLRDSLVAGRPLILMPSISWYTTLHQRSHHLAKSLSKSGFTVVYVDEQLKIPRKINNNLYIINDDEEYHSIIKNNGNSDKYYWLFSTSSIGLNDLKTELGKTYKLIYDYIDEHSPLINDDYSRQVEIFKQLNTLKPSVFVASARKLYDDLVEKLNVDNIVMAQNAVDIEHFKAKRSRIMSQAPSDLLPLIRQGKPIVGYYGALAPWLDYTLINKLTDERGDLQFVFIGADYDGGLSKLKIRDNVVYLGTKSYVKLPAYSKWFDCAIIPFKKGDIAKATSPVKLFEYMAMALPTVCTRDLYECQGYEYVYMSKNYTEFKENIDVAIKAKRSGKSYNRLVGYAKENTWQARAKNIADKVK